MQGDEQEPDKRCGTPGTSWHVTAKFSIRMWVCFINLALMHGRFCVLPREISFTPQEAYMAESG
jgi:hypothetical protein